MDLVTVNDGVITTSKIIAASFLKTHKHVLEAIKNLDYSPDFIERNFIKSHYISLQNKKLPCYEITRDGAILLCMGFNGEIASKGKRKLLNAINSKDSSDIMAAISNMDIDIDDKDLFVYVAQESISKRYKIGISKNPEERVKALNVGNPETLSIIHKYKAANDKFKDEVIAHEFYKGQRLVGEWFESDIDLSFLLEIEKIN